MSSGADAAGGADAAPVGHVHGRFVGGSHYGVGWQALALAPPGYDARGAPPLRHPQAFAHSQQPGPPAGAYGDLAQPITQLPLDQRQLPFQAALTRSQGAPVPPTPKDHSGAGAAA